MISIILAMDKNGLIGKNNDLPWHYPEDLKYFKDKTLSHKVLMGRKTFESIVKRLNKPLPKRTSIVASKHGFTYPGVEVIQDLNSYLSQETKEEIFVIGGKSIFEKALPYVKRLYITHIDKVFEGDTYIDIDLSNFDLISEDKHGELCFAIYERRDDLC